MVMRVAGVTVVPYVLFMVTVLTVTLGVEANTYRLPGSTPEGAKVLMVLPQAGVVALFKLPNVLLVGVLL